MRNLIDVPKISDLAYLYKFRISDGDIRVEARVDVLICEQVGYWYNG